MALNRSSLSLNKVKCQMFEVLSEEIMLQITIGIK